MQYFPPISLFACFYFQLEVSESEFLEIEEQDILVSALFPPLKSWTLEGVDSVCTYNGCRKCHKGVQQGSACPKCGSMLDTMPLFVVKLVMSIDIELQKKDCVPCRIAVHDACV